MTITAKFASVCPCCNQRIVAGTKVEWTRGSKARHVACASHPGAVSVASVPARSSNGSGYGRRGRWTGCSCGSREDSSGCLIPSDRNCESCEFDA